MVFLPRVDPADKNLRWTLGFSSSKLISLKVSFHRKENHSRTNISLSLSFYFFPSQWIINEVPILFVKAWSQERTSNGTVPFGAFVRRLNRGLLERILSFLVTSPMRVILLVDSSSMTINLIPLEERASEDFSERIRKWKDKKQENVESNNSRIAKVGETDAVDIPGKITKRYISFWL